MSATINPEREPLWRHTCGRFISNDSFGGGREAGGLPGGMYWHDPVLLTSTFVWKVASNLSSALQKTYGELRREIGYFKHTDFYLLPPTLRLHIIRNHSKITALSACH